MANSELQLEMAKRDQVIHNQREALKNLWNLLMGLGLDEKQILHLAAKQGLTIEGWPMTPLVLSEKQSSNPSSSRSTSVGPSSGIEYFYAGCSRFSWHDVCHDHHLYHIYPISLLQGGKPKLVRLSMA